LKDDDFKPCFQKSHFYTPQLLTKNKPRLKRIKRGLFLNLFFNATFLRGVAQELLLLADVIIL
jgi:hypothetical protein